MLFCKVSFPTLAGTAGIPFLSFSNAFMSKSKTLIVLVDIVKLIISLECTMMCIACFCTIRFFIADALAVIAAVSVLNRSKKSIFFKISLSCFSLFNSFV